LFLLEISSIVGVLMLNTTSNNIKCVIK
jgi:hypothetical protein